MELQDLSAKELILFGLIMRGYLDNIRDLVEEADRRIKERTPPGKRGPGRPPTDPADVAKALLLQTYADASNRATEGLLLLFREKLGISRHFSYMLNNLWQTPTIQSAIPTS